MDPLVGSFASPGGLVKSRLYESGVYTLTDTHMQPTTRKVVHRSPAHTVRLLHLMHLQTDPVEADSKLERDFVHIAALFPRIQSISHQPFKLVWDDKSYTPDFLLGFLDGSKLTVEVKPKAKVNEYESLFVRAKEKLQQHQIGFLVATDEYISKKRAQNALLIRRYSKATFTDMAKSEILLAVAAATNGLTVDEICLGDQNKFAVLLNLIAYRKLSTNPALDISAKAKINLPKINTEANDALQFASWFNS